jgi:chemotaxis protein MotA
VRASSEEGSLNRIVGILVVVGCVLGGFLMAKGKIATLVQPAEFIVIAGAAAGSLLISASPPTLKKMQKRIAGVFTKSPFDRNSAAELLQLLYHLTIVVKREGVITLENHLRDPESSTIFSSYQTVLKNKKLLGFLIDALSLQVDGAVTPEDLKGIMERELDTHHEEDSVPAALLAKTGDALPGLGIVAAVLGIIITMSYMAEGAEVVGHHVACALVGTFLGVLLSYGFVGPLAGAMEADLRDEGNFFEAVKTGMVAFAQGKAPVVVTEVARRSLFGYNRPSAEQVEEACKALRAA